MGKTIHFSDGTVICIEQDDNAFSPREDDNLGTMVCFHSRYRLGDEADGLRGHGYFPKDFNSLDELEAKILEDHPDCVILPLYLFDHSGITISTSCEMFRACDGAGWDWGQVGFIFISREKIDEEYKEHGGRTDEEICKYLAAEVATYDQYLQGDIWGYTQHKECPTCGKIEDEQTDSCWGFYGDDPLENGMAENWDNDYVEALKAHDENRQLPEAAVVVTSLTEK